MTSSGSVGHFGAGDQQKAIKVEAEDEDHRSGEPPRHKEHVSDVDQQNEEFHVKEESEDEDFLCGGTLSCVVYQQTEGLQAEPSKEEKPDDDDDDDDDEYLFCEFCSSFFINKCETHGPALFLPDTPVPRGVPGRARRTLPPGLDIQTPEISAAALGVFNKGDSVPVGAHFGPYQGDLVDQEKAVASKYSWVIYSRKFTKYIDANRVTQANWMRYVNCARNSEDTNLLAFQYQGEIFFRCCRAIKPRQELLVWYEERYAQRAGLTLSRIWDRKCCVSEDIGQPVRSFSCFCCSLFYSSQRDLQDHIQKCHRKENTSRETPKNTQHTRKSTHTAATCAKGTFSCSQCGKRFAGRCQLKQHQRIHTGERPFPCSQCGKRFARQSHLQMHQAIHTGEKLYACLQCGKRFNRQSTLQRHHRIHTGDKPYRCSDCGKAFTYQDALQRHQRVHTGEKPYSCSECGKKFTYHDALQRHRRFHTGEKPYVCSACGRGFSQSNSLHVHQLVHSTETPYPCSHCGKLFVQPNALETHLRIHTGERPFHCGQCGKSFNQESALQRHRRTHTGERPHRCSLCGKSFARPCHLKRHQHIHSGKKPYCCAECGKCFNRESSLQRHRHTHTGHKLFICSKCGKRFTRQSNLRTHLLTHTQSQCTQAVTVHTHTNTAHTH